MRSARQAVLVAIFLLTGGCNKGKDLMGEARKQHDSGRLDGALSTLAQVRQQAPGTPEVAEAASLATTWLIAAADAAPVGAAERVQRAKEVLASWDPQSGAAQARVCRFAREAEAWDVLAGCLDKGLNGKHDVPPDVIDPLRSALSAHRAELQQKADAENRAALLASDDEANWEALQQQFPGSPEAKFAAEKLARAQALCSDLDRYWSLYDQFQKDTVAILGRLYTSPQKLLYDQTKSTPSPKGGDELTRLIDQTAASARTLATRAHDTVTRIHAHKAATGEQLAQHQLEKFFQGLENSYNVLVGYCNTVDSKWHPDDKETLIQEWKETWAVMDESVLGPERNGILAVCASASMSSPPAQGGAAGGSHPAAFGGLGFDPSTLPGAGGGGPKK
jgi:hypothetical protein